MKTNNYLSIVGVILVILSLTLLAAMSLQGQTIVRGANPDEEKSIYLKCSSSMVSYPFFAYDNSNERNMLVNILFNNDKIASVSLIYSLYYNSYSSVSASEAHNHAEMNKAFAALGLLADSFSARYAKADDKMTMSLYAKKEDLSIDTMKFFMAPEVSPNSDINKLEKNYTEQGFTCNNNQ